MIRDTFFSLHRFVNVCRKEMVENWKTYILRSVMVYGMLAIVFVWNGYYQYHNLEAGAVGMDPIWEFESRFFLYVADHILFPLSRQSPDVTIESMLYWLFSLS